MNKFSRRHFIQITAIGSGSLLLFPRCANLSTRSSWRFFTEKEASMVTSLIEQIIPADEWPGAKEAGVANFIDKQLVGPYTRFQRKYRDGLASVETTCQTLYHKQFEELAWNEQTRFLEKMESGKLADLLKGDGQQGSNIWQDDLDKLFFNLICDHTMQGFYGSSRHGGNKDYVSYKMVGLDYPFIVGQNRY